MKLGGQILWNITPMCETFKISCLMGRRPMKDVLGNHVKDLLFHLVHWLSITLLLRRTSQESINLEIHQCEIRGESHLDFLGQSEGSLPPPHDSFPDAGEAINDFWSMSGNFIYCHHVEPRVKLYSPREESFPIPLKYIDVSRTTHTNLDVKQEKRIDDYWNVDGSSDLSDPWAGFTQFTLLEEKPPDGNMWSGRRQTRKHQTSRPDHLWPELWKTMGKHAKLKEKQKWSNEKLHLENALKL